MDIEKDRKCFREMEIEAGGWAGVVIGEYEGYWE